jgi:hypothetical protein
VKGRNEIKWKENKAGKIKGGRGNGSERFDFPVSSFGPLLGSPFTFLFRV